MESLEDIASELAKLQELEGSEFIVQLKRITNHNGFHQIETDPNGPVSFLYHLKKDYS